MCTFHVSCVCINFGFRTPAIVYYIYIQPLTSVTFVSVFNSSEIRTQVDLRALWTALLRPIPNLLQKTDWCEGGKEGREGEKEADRRS